MTNFHVDNGRTGGKVPTLYFLRISRMATTWALAKRDRALMSSLIRCSSLSNLADFRCRRMSVVVFGSSGQVAAHRVMLEDNDSTPRMQKFLVNVINSHWLFPYILSRGGF